MNILSSQPGTSSQADQLMELEDEHSTSKRIRLQRSQNTSSQNMLNEEKMQTVSRIIKYLLTADQSKHPISRVNIIKNLELKPKEYNLFIKEVEVQLSEVHMFILIIYTHIIYNIK